MFVAQLESFALDVDFEVLELVAKLEKNLAILNSSGGGITFSGGEPLFSSAFLLECLKALKVRTHRAVQTSGYSSEETFKEVLENCDYGTRDIAEELAEATRSEVVAVIGRKVVLYRESENKKRIEI